MNERIAELLEQAFAECKTFENGTMIRTTEALAKFAELIVKECANVAAEHEALDIYEEIREHFGVEE